MVATDRGNRVELSSRYLQAGNIEHAYALTGHMAQGLTVERAFVLGSTSGELQEWGYVALSRASEATRLYITGSQVEPDNHFQEVDDRDPLTRLAQALETSGAETLAQDRAREKPHAESPSRPVIVRRSPAERELERARAQLRTLAGQEKQANKLLERVEHRLAEIEKRIAGLGWRDRRRHRGEFERERAFQRIALRSVESRLAELGPEKRQALERVELAAAKLPAREHEREQSRVIEPRVERQLGLDLGL